MNFREAQKKLYSRRMFGIKLGLVNMKKLLAKVGNPERSFASIHIAGTNGKGSTSAILASLLQARGVRTGLFTSPHLSSVRERYKINGTMISPRDFARYYAKIDAYLDDIPCTFFECTTVIAFLYFKENNVETAVIETGLGGRYDATNVVEPICSVITTISYDHMEFLGNSLQDIAREKSGIIKKQAPVVTAVEQDVCLNVITSAAAKKNVSVHYVKDYVSIVDSKGDAHGTRFTVQIKGKHFTDLYLPIAGAFQLNNVCTALTVLSVLYNNLTGEWLKCGLKTVDWPARFQLYKKNHPVIVDVAHNEEGFRVLKKEIMELFPGKSVLLVVGLKKDKVSNTSFEVILPLCRKGFGVPFRAFKAMTSKDLKAPFKKYNVPFSYYSSVRAGLFSAYANAGKNDIILCAGSHFTVNSLKKVLNSLD